MKKIKIEELIKDIEQNTDITLLKKASENVDIESIKKDGVKTANLLINAIKKSNIRAINLHKEKLKKQIKPVANDNPFEIGERVSVTRHEHGWVGGYMEAKILSRYNSNGIWSYEAEVISEDMKGCEIHINHTRDATSVQKPKKIKRNIK